jgi:hypothetical protein
MKKLLLIALLPFGCQAATQEVTFKSQVSWILSPEQEAAAKQERERDVAELRQQLVEQRKRRLGITDEVKPVRKAVVEKLSVEQQQLLEQEHVVKVAAQMAANKEHQKQARVQRRQQEREAQHQMQLAKLERKRASLDKKLVKKAMVCEQARKKRIAAWCYYRNNKWAADLLIKEVKRVDKTNLLHVVQLQEQVCLFGAKVNLAAYPDLKAFLAYKVAVNH